MHNRRLTKNRNLLESAVGHVPGQGNKSSCRYIEVAKCKGKVHGCPCYSKDRTQRRRGMFSEECLRGKELHIPTQSKNDIR
eukprot:825250-Prorocentrum_lima.AAC.1